MSMSDARQFAELSARVDTLESRVQELADRVLGKDVSEEVLGPVADETARDGLRAMLKERRQGIVPEGNPLETPGVDYPKFEDKPKEASEPDLAADPGLKDRLAALQGAEAAPQKPGMRK